MMPVKNAKLIWKHFLNNVWKSPIIITNISALKY